MKFSDHLLLAYVVKSTLYVETYYCRAVIQAYLRWKAALVHFDSMESGVLDDVAYEIMS